MPQTTTAEGGRKMQNSSGNTDNREHALVNVEYVKTLFHDYFPNDDERSIAILAQRIVDEFEVEIFSRIRELCHRDAAHEGNWK
ncbi:MAG: hypothetical protein P4N59_00605 [Negativicutes bacterium]|nr:hypothetical protein [Negativicutes bacterium]